MSEADLARKDDMIRALSDALFHVMRFSSIGRKGGRWEAQRLAYTGLWESARAEIAHTEPLGIHLPRDQFMAPVPLIAFLGYRYNPDQVQGMFHDLIPPGITVYDALCAGHFEDAMSYLEDQLAERE